MANMIILLVNLKEKKFIKLFDTQYLSPFPSHSYYQ